MYNVADLVTQLVSKYCNVGGVWLANQILVVHEKRSYFLWIHCSNELKLESSPVLVAVVDGIDRHSTELFAVADQHLRDEDVFLTAAETKHLHHWVDLRLKYFRQLHKHIHHILTCVSWIPTVSSAKVCKFSLNAYNICLTPLKSINQSVNPLTAMKK